MTRTVRIDADLRVQLDPTGTGEDRVTGTVRGSGTHLTLTWDRLDLLQAAGRGRLLRRTAALAARRGLTLTIAGPSGPLVTLGVVRSRWWHRLATRSRHVLVHDWRTAVRTTVRRRGASGGGPTPPPPTPWPPAPTFRRGRRVVTTTHDPRGGGRPRLVFALGPAPQPGDEQRVVALPPTTTVIGSGPDADLRLAGLDARHAEVRRDEQDEYVLVPLGDPALTRVNGASADRHVLRTGCRIELGPWTMAYRRDEYADHGRPYGGRSGGELSRQRPQPVPTYRRPPVRRQPPPRTSGAPDSRPPT